MLVALLVGHLLGHDVVVEQLGVGERLQVARLLLADLGLGRVQVVRASVVGQYAIDAPPVVTAHTCSKNVRIWKCSVYT